MKKPLPASPVRRLPRKSAVNVTGAGNKPKAKDAVIDGEVVGGKKCVGCGLNTLSRTVLGPVKVPVCEKCIYKMNRGLKMVGMFSKILQRVLL